MAQAPTEVPVEQTPKSFESSTWATASGSASEKERKENKSFERWRKTLSLITGIGLTPEEFQAEVDKADRKQCELHKERLIKSNKSGGFSKDHGIMLCQNGFFSKKHQEHTMIHEMIHMYDHCVFNVEWDNLRHHACSEIRAAALSGDCNWLREVRRGNYTFTKQHQECVKRRAILSVEANPECPSRTAAERAVNGVLVYNKLFSFAWL
ncbi:peptidase M76 family-domain-containing protein [Lobosporangium transversale]|uniref:Mitochondrial inner membrane protease ATP23 n=1 Tax=Lobosporangium transversale TaxID=64571 RepID=A0A1Y2GHA9_9FUNG|nr:peptidase M76 family-domain-containing protein [Lobosporangium transversale]ORZ10969.1 peptidase M76 family-domain-containing protein [Lobosporangium transversale]|eukprot:XP_021879486.1 peptidase M76 family-domain-containing protein [Lobosporangium transversale]